MSHHPCVPSSALSHLLLVIQFVHSSSLKIAVLKALQWLRHFKILAMVLFITNRLPFSLVIAPYSKLVKALLIPLIICFINVISFCWMPPLTPPLPSMEPLNYWVYSVQFLSSYFNFVDHMFSHLKLGILLLAFGFQIFFFFKETVFLIIFGLVLHCQCFYHMGSPWDNSHGFFLSYYLIILLLFSPAAFHPLYSNAFGSY